MLVTCAAVLGPRGGAASPVVRMDAAELKAVLVAVWRCCGTPTTAFGVRRSTLFMFDPDGAATR